MPVQKAFGENKSAENFTGFYIICQNTDERIALFGLGIVCLQKLQYTLIYS